MPSLSLVRPVAHGAAARPNRTLVECSLLMPAVAALLVGLLSVLCMPAPAYAWMNTSYCPHITCTDANGNPGGRPQAHGDTGVASPEVVPIFWEGAATEGAGCTQDADCGTATGLHCFSGTCKRYWTNATVSSNKWGATRQQELANLQLMVNGPFLAALGQYLPDGMAQARMVPAGPIDDAGFPSGLLTPCSHDSDCPAYGTCVDNLCQISNETTKGDALVCGKINAMIGAGLVPEPDPNSTVYALYLPPVDVGIIAGRNFTCPWNGTQYYALWVWGQDLHGLAHELAEAVTFNVRFPNCGGPQQAADLCTCYSENVQAGITLTPTYQPYWSAVDNGGQGACIVPEAWSGVYKYSGGWKELTNANVKQIYAGGSGLFATKPDDQLYEYTSGAWTSIGSSPSAMFSVGTSWVLGMGAAGEAVSRWDAGTRSWSTTSFGEASAVYSGLFRYRHRSAGRAVSGRRQYRLVLGGTSGPASGSSTQFVVGDDWAAALDLNRKAYVLPGYGSGSFPNWSAWIPAPTNSSVSELFVGGAQSLGGRDTTSGGIDVITTVPGNGTFSINPWYAMGGTGASDFALSDDTSKPIAAMLPDYGGDGEFGARYDTRLVDSRFGPEPGGAPRGPREQHLHDGPVPRMPGPGGRMQRFRTMLRLCNRDLYQQRLPIGNRALPRLVWICERSTINGSQFLTPEAARVR